jgi:hypothetical protein
MRTRLHALSPHNARRLEISKQIRNVLLPASLLLMRYQTNVLVNDKGTACLADFGITSLNTESHTVLRADRGTVPYMAPERLQHLEMVAQIQEPAAEPTKEADIYALALVMWEASKT